MKYLEQFGKEQGRNVYRFIIEDRTYFLQSFPQLASPDGSWKFHVAWLSSDGLSCNGSSKLIAYRNWLRLPGRE